jgi:hypothetical protein
MGFYLKRSLKGLEVKKVLVKVMHGSLTSPSSGNGGFVELSSRSWKCLIIAVGARGSIASHGGG